MTKEIVIDSEKKLLKYFGKQFNIKETLIEELYPYGKIEYPKFVRINKK